MVSLEEDEDRDMGGKAIYLSNSWLDRPRPC